MALTVAKKLAISPKPVAMHLAPGRTIISNPLRRHRATGAANVVCRCKSIHVPAACQFFTACTTGHLTIAILLPGLS